MTPATIPPGDDGPRPSAAFSVLAAMPDAFIAHYADGGVRAAKFDWRGGTGPCRHGKGCSCRAFVPARRSVSEGARDE